MYVVIVIIINAHIYLTYLNIFRIKWINDITLLKNDYYNVFKIHKLDFKIRYADTDFLPLVLIPIHVYFP